MESLDHHSILTFLVFIVMSYAVDSDPLGQSEIKSGEVWGSA